MTRLLLVVVTWRLVGRLAAPVIVVAFALALLHGSAFAHHQEQRTARATERVVWPIEHDLQRTLRKAFRR